MDKTVYGTPSVWRGSLREPSVTSPFDVSSRRHDADDITTDDVCSWTLLQSSYICWRDVSRCLAKLSDFVSPHDLKEETHTTMKSGCRL